jgi:DNA-directed RNA polymerase subunit L
LPGVIIMKLKSVDISVRPVELLTNEVFKPMFIIFRIDGLTQQWANAIRRVFTDEIPIRVLALTNFQCGDKYIKPEIVRYQLATLKINQQIELGTVFELDVEGSRIPTSDDFKISRGGKGLAINKGIELIELVQYTNQRIKMIAHVEEWRKHIYGQGMASLVNQVRVTAHEDDLIGEQEYQFDLDLHNNIEPRTLLHLCFNTLINRARAASENRNFVQVMIKDDKIEYNIRYPNETYTLGNLIYDAVYFIDPQIPFMTATARDTDLLMRFVVHSRAYLEDVLNRAFTKIINAFTELDSQIDEKIK